MDNGNLPGSPAAQLDNLSAEQQTELLRFACAESVENYLTAAREALALAALAANLRSYAPGDFTVAAEIEADAAKVLTRVLEEAWLKVVSLQEALPAATHNLKLVAVPGEPARAWTLPVSEGGVQ